MRRLQGFQDALSPPAPRRGRKDRPVIDAPSRPSGSGRAGSALPTTADDRARLSRVIAKAPEVMVKVTGKTSGAGHLQAHLDYISRNGEVKLEGRAGIEFEGREVVYGLGDAWSADIEADENRRRDSPHSVSIILSMPAGTDPYDVRDAARAFARETFSDRFDYVMAYHGDTRSPHVHLTVKPVGDNGERLNLRKADLDAMRQTFARELRSRGVEAEATPRRARGVTRKAEPIAIRKLKGRGVASSREAQARTEARRLERGQDTTPRPWETAAKARRDAIQNAFMDTAEALAKTGKPEDRRLGVELARFTEGMAPCLSRREAMALEMRADHLAGRSIEQGRGEAPTRSAPEGPSRSEPKTPDRER